MAQRLYEDHGGMPYLTCVVVRVNARRRELAYVNAGHPPGIVVEQDDRTVVAFSFDSRVSNTSES